jgi:hypothetical protein
MTNRIAIVVSGALLSCSRPAHLGAQAGSAPLASSSDTVPAGFGSLRRDDLVMRFATDQLQLQILPLDERVIRLLAPDTYRSLEGLLDSRRQDIADAARRAGLTNPTLVMVTFFGQVSGARFSPEDVQLQSRGRLFRPVDIVPLSPTWSTLQLDQRQQAVAIYLFDRGVSWLEELSASYQNAPAGNWTRALQVLEQERARVLARAQTRPPAPNQ